MFRVSRFPIWIRVRFVSTILVFVRRAPITCRPRHQRNGVDRQLVSLIDDDDDSDDDHDHDDDDSDDDDGGEEEQQ